MEPRRPGQTRPWRTVKTAASPREATPSCQDGANVFGGVRGLMKSVSAISVSLPATNRCNTSSSRGERPNWRSVSWTSLFRESGAGEAILSCAARAITSGSGRSWPRAHAAAWSPAERLRPSPGSAPNQPLFWALDLQICARGAAAALQSSTATISARRGRLAMPSRLAATPPRPTRWASSAASVRPRADSGCPAVSRIRPQAGPHLAVRPAHPGEGR